jgi:thiol-disulfide isomerase/thioredoxin
MALGHPSALLAREVQFTLKNENFSATRVRLFCPGVERTRSLNILISQMGDRLTTGIEHGEGQMGQQQQGRLTSRNSNEFRFVILEKQVELYVDGGLWQTFSSSSAARPGAGLIIEPASVWGNAAESVVISKFTSTPAPGFVAPPVIAPETKEQALTVPRFRKELPPRHALVGLNGDVLRGEIEAMTATHFGFRSGLETLRVPRDRVQAIIWLQPPSSVPAAPAPAAEEKLAELNQPISMQTEMPLIPLSSCFQFLQQNQFGDVQFILPKERQTKQVALSLHGQTLREALDELCAAADMSYKIEPKKRIVFKAGASAASGIYSRIYWLPAKAFADAAGVQAALTTKGVEFPEGTSATWDAASGQLTVVNSSANHLKLGEVLKADFGAGLSEPTHWLQLGNGARFGLTVQKFDADSIRGTNPLYGDCRVPLKQVYTIDSAPPARNPALQELASWQLVSAREPVLPETGGESSPILGKEAKTFTLPLVGGGEFDLAKAKGKVVVLDFWATWCGPCIRSLPGLIKAMAEFPAERVEFIGIDQGEAEPQVKQFLAARDWKLRTALDSTLSVGRLFGVEGIPHTVVIAPDGKVSWVHTGYSAEAADQIAAAVKKLLEAK